MRINKYISFILILISTQILFSCVDIEDFFSYEKGEPIAVQFKISVSKENQIGEDNLKSNTKAPNNINENIVSDIWVLQFDGTNTSSSIRNVQYINVSTTNLGLNLLSSSTLNRVVVIANTHNQSFDWSNVTSYQSLLDKLSAINVEADIYGGINNKGVIMSGYTDVIVNNVSPITPIQINVTRSVAKIELNIALNSGSGLTIDSIAICDVPSEFNIADTLKVLHNIVSAPYPIHSSTIYKTFSEKIGMPLADGLVKTFQWYVPRNIKGTNAGTTVANKNTNAPQGASYIRIFAKKSNNDPVIYRLYPGKNMINDFNIIPNNKYIVNIRINSAGDYTTDSRVEYLSEIIDYTTKSYSNCYIINPSTQQGITRKYKIPVGRVDDYWGSSALGYGNNTGFTLSASNPWTVSLLWQDTIALVQSSSTTNISFSKTSGTGKNDYFEINVPSSAKHGNFVVKIVNSNNPTVTLWSWHFWVTDYNPYYAGTFTTGEIDKSYPVTSGSVQRYAGGVWASGGELQNSYILDRDIGNLSTTHTPSLTSRGVMYYQFGRKDPFPSDVPLYNISGTAVVISKTNSTSTMKNSVNNPTSFYRAPSQKGDWCSEVLGNSIIWNDVNAISSSITKSIFDPSPWGFRLPKQNVYSNFNSTNFISSGSYRTYNSFAKYYMDGYRVYTSGNISGSSSNGRLWYSLPQAIDFAYYFDFTSTTINDGGFVAKAFGNVCRPVRE